MRISIPVFFILIAGCGIRPDHSDILYQMAVSDAEEYIMNKYPETKMISNEDGSLTYMNNKNTFFLSGNNIKTGLINDDNLDDVIISIDVFSGQYQVTSEHLFFLSSGDSLILDCVLESDMKILFIKDNIITADVPMHSRNSPLFNCASCREVLNYSLRKGELIRAD